MPDADPKKTVYVCKVDATHTVRLEDIPIEDFGPLQDEHGERWYVMVNATLACKPLTLLALYRKCCAMAGVEPLAVPTAGEITAMFDVVDDDRPTMYSGGLPDPKADDLRIAG